MKSHNRSQKPRINFRSITVSSFNEYKAAIAKITDDNPDSYFYRGQPDASWPVDCSASRRLREHLGIIDDALLQLPLFAYIHKLVRQAQDDIDMENVLSQVELLAQLQHHGAATHLIDFTECVSVALWFACSERLHTHGAVYLIDKAKTHATTTNDPATYAGWHESEILRHWKPNPSPRVSRQQSVFVFGPPVIEKGHLHKIVILADKKPTMLKHLQNDGITRSWLFPDIPGVAEQNKVCSPIKEHDLLQYWDKMINRDSLGERESAAILHVDGMMYAAVERHVDAIACYDKSLQIREHSPGYNSRGLSRKFMGDLYGALADFDAAIALEPESGLMHSNRAQVLLQLGRMEEGWQAYELAIQYGHNPLSQPIMSPSSVPMP